MQEGVGGARPEGRKEAAVMANLPMARMMEAMARMMEALANAVSDVQKEMKSMKVTQATKVTPDKTPSEEHGGLQKGGS
jgi:hypothetical protein